MALESPNVVMLAGPNGAGKSTAAADLLKGELRVPEFVNADTIAKGLSEFAPNTVSIGAGRLMLDRLHELAARRSDFAFETTLASRTFAPWINRLIAGGYVFRLVFLWLPSLELCQARVAARARSGGHFVPADVVKRRYASGLRNFFLLYRPLATSWRFYDNTRQPDLLAEGVGPSTNVYSPEVWHTLESRYSHERRE
jgi:predicted ABC-type ATPase